LKLIYLDTSAVLKRYVEEVESEECEQILSNFQKFTISNIGVTETLINLRRKLVGLEGDLAVRLFEADLNSYDVVEFNKEIGREAVEVSGGKNLATLDSIHIASALRFKTQDITFLTYDRSQALAARRNGLKTLGVLS
jgi:predicted nucleic acid-binding protein